MSIEEKYSMEISEINRMLENIKNGRFKENTKANSDGYLATNVENLKNEIFGLLKKIENNSDSKQDKILKSFGFDCDPSIEEK